MKRGDDMGTMIGKGMTVTQLDEALNGNVEHPIARAVLAMLDMRMLDGVDRALDEGLEDKGTYMCLGETRALMGLKEELVQRLRQERGS